MLQVSRLPLVYNFLSLISYCKRIGIVFGQIFLPRTRFFNHKTSTTVSNQASREINSKVINPYLQAAEPVPTSRLWNLREPAEAIGDARLQGYTRLAFGIGPIACGESNVYSTIPPFTDELATNTKFILLKMLVTAFLHSREESRCHYLHRALLLVPM